MMLFLNALASCLPLIILCGTITVLSWENRGQIELLQINSNGLNIQFGKSGKSRKQ